MGVTTVTEAAAVFDLIHWLAARPKWLGVAGDAEGAGARVSDERAVEALELLAASAGKKLQLTIQRDLVIRGVGRLRAADSDGRAQAVCETILRHVRHGGALPWPAISQAFDEWRRVQEREARR